MVKQVKLVIFEIGEGSFERGFPVKVRIGEAGKRHIAEISGRLPPAPEVPTTYTTWQSIYEKLPANWLIIIPKNQITNFSSKDACNQAAKAFQDSFNTWLNQAPVLEIERQLSRQIGNSEDIRFILQTSDSLLRRLPWHLWGFFSTSHPQAEIVIGSEYEPSTKQLKVPVKILAILGSNQGIDLNQDLYFLKNLPGAKVKALIEPTRRQLIDNLRTQPWDILFFAGHSISKEGDSWGEIQINADESYLSLRNLRYSLRHAVRQGLKLAIFNSCDGLGLARNLADLRIPYTIVMREPVPDIIAQEFLKYFLTAFTSGESLYASVNQARERLYEEWERDYPCASWLPVIFQNPAATELKYPRILNWKQKAFRTAIVTVSLGCVGAVLWRGIDEINFRNRFSDGDKILVKTVSTEYKKQGVQALSWKNYNQAVSKFKISLQQKPNDPESLIYLNNAKIGNQEKLTIAVVVPIGTNPDVAQEILRGVAQAQDEINRRDGINSQLLKVEIVNDDNNPAIAQRVANRFVQDQKNILAVIGHNSSDASVPAANIYQAGKLVMISPTSTSPLVTNPENRSAGSYIYRTVIRNDVIAETLAEYAKKEGKTRIAICRDSQAKDQSYEPAIASALSKNDIQLIDIHCDLSAKNFQPEVAIERAIKVRANSIFLNPHVDRIDKAIEVAKANKGKLMLFGSHSMQTQKTLKAGKAVNGLVMAVSWHTDASANKKFVKDAYKLWSDPNSITWRTANAYDATNAIAQALIQKDNTREGIQQALSGSFVLEGATGTIQFSPWGDRIGTAVLVEVKPDPKNPSNYSFVLKDSVFNRISLGDKILAQDTQPSNEKKAGIQAFAAEKYEVAIAYFQKSLQNMPNDPETHIYLQNALAARHGKVLKIAVSVPLGSNPNVAKEILQGVAQAQDEVNNKGGIQGYLLQIEIANDDNNPDIARKIANYFVNHKKILAVIAHNASDASVKACGIYQDGKLVNISPTSFSLKLSGCGSYIFRTAPNLRFLADSVSHYAINVAGTKNLAICVDEKAIDNQSFRDEFASATIADGGNIVNIRCDFSAPDFDPPKIIADAISNGAEGLFLAPHIDRISKALDLAKANQGRLTLFASTSLYTLQTLQQGKADINNLVLAVPWEARSNFESEFAKNSRKLWRSLVTWRSATSYDATVAIVNGLQQSKTRDGLQKVLRNPKFSAIGATGKIQFLQSGDRHIQNKNDIILVKIKPSHKFANQYEFFPLSP
ncbi:ABC transporter substrate-binding protein [Fischerella sp. JS2]|uniref:ABC transporter substrate-binding protein n=1 Tax=Fischerella sp. JS2 TaxID=2597771 RepID=UPI0028E64C2C|nr:ABC transporter substrate-binding protein [Fischerella sp. JS2]